MYNLRADLFERGTESQAGGDERTVVYSRMLESSATAPAVAGRSRFRIDLETLVESPS
jgi:hypothetical protein